MTMPLRRASWTIEILKKRLGAGHADLESLYLGMADLQRCDGNEEEADRYEKLAINLKG